MASLARFNPAVALGFMLHSLRDAQHEMLVVTHLNAQGDVIWRQVVLSREEASITFPLRDIVAKALVLNTDTLIVAHNHPSGVAEPSRADIRLTRLLERVVEPLDVRLEDHLIVTRRGHYSFRENGLL